MKREMYQAMWIAISGFCLGACVIMTADHPDLAGYLGCGFNALSVAIRFTMLRDCIS